MTTRLEGLLDDAQPVQAIKRPVSVRVIFAATAGTVATLKGLVQHRSGAVIVAGGGGERWPVERASFLASDKPVPPSIAGRATII